MSLKSDPDSRGVKVWLPAHLASELEAIADDYAPGGGNKPSKSLVVADALTAFFDQAEPMPKRRRHCMA